MYILVIVAIIALVSVHGTPHKRRLRRQFNRNRLRSPVFDRKKLRNTPTANLQDSDQEMHIFLTACGGFAAKQALSVARSIYTTSKTLRTHIHFVTDGSVEIREQLLKPLEILLEFGMIDPSRFRYTSAESNAPFHLRHMLGQGKPCATARLMIAAEHPTITRALYIDVDTIINKDLAELWATADTFTEQQWCSLAEDQVLPVGL